MTKKKAVLTVTEDLSGLFNGKSERFGGKVKKAKLLKEGDKDRLTIEKALATVTRQMEISGNRPRTISDYNIYVMHFIGTVRTTYVDELNADHIYEWLAIMDVSKQTKLTRLKCLKAFLSRCFDNGWIERKFWRPINIKVDNIVKEGAAERDINILLSVLNLNDFVQLRDATALLLMYKTGLRINTIVHLENRHIDLENNLMKIDGSIIKNHDQLLLPIDGTLNRLLTVLLNQNEAIRTEYHRENNYVFITKQGGIIATSQTHNNIQKRLNKYAKEYGLKNINPHALRRGFAKNLLEKGANIAHISKALGHSNLAVTSQYLHLDKEEVAENLRKFL
ncbi:site-specific integrase [Bacillus sp. ISL-45]|uniref:tyrosine-type recombinase/integrase n=1 Tax=Bacillus sp. ISL-45 TaxID=2819128 RepID=UPI001BE520C3|nr:site-specific integrase [Bacillus sp. ISL-45]MBT2660585.1 site-specific integrase [Bacillus sp. ISL-45]